MKILTLASLVLMSLITGCGGGGDSSDPYQAPSTGSTGTGSSTGTTAPVITLSLASNSINEGQSTTLTWSSKNASSVNINGTSEPLSGSMTVSPNQSTNYKATATGNTGQTATQSLSLTVNSGFQVTEANPSGTSAVAINSSLSLTFTTPVDASSLFYNSGLPGDSDDVILSITSNSQKQEMAISVSVSSDVMTIKPLVDLVPDTNYTLTLGTKIHDTSNRTLTQPYSLTFKTAAGGTVNPTAVTLTVYSAITTQTISYFEGFWDEQSHGVPVKESEGTYIMIPPASSVYASKDMLVTNPSTPIGPQSVSAPYVATLNNNLFTSGHTYFFAFEACNESQCSVYSPEIGATIP